MSPRGDARVPCAATNLPVSPNSNRVRGLRHTPCISLTRRRAATVARFGADKTARGRLKT
ncbi:hypothetical protein [Neisseria bacilliformis]|uniref:hypothetical protein n=1 Tax=Neisseria bacilliformis TaxID=267212 RepID=UPI00128E07A9|nr:hypothetical protein [Neisseria bacilliformis]